MFIKLRDAIKRSINADSKIWTLLHFTQGILFFMTYMLYYRTKRQLEKKVSLKEINIEFCNICNLRCKYCALDHTKEKVLLEQKTLERFFENLMYDDRFRKVEVINLHNGGETLMHPDFRKLMDVIFKYKKLAKELGKKFPKVKLLTNATLLTKAKAESIIASGAVDIFQFSIDGGEAKEFEVMRYPAKWEVFQRNVSQFLEINNTTEKPLKTSAICIVPEGKPMKITWMEESFQDIVKEVDYLELRRAHSWAGEIEVKHKQKKKFKMGCMLLLNQLVLLPDGNFTVCCNDLNSKYIIGNIMRQDLFNIYRSQKRLELISLHYKGKKQLSHLCGECETF